MIKVYIVLNKILFLTGILVFLSGTSLKAQQTDSTVTGYLYFINSNPFNAEVYFKDSLLGLTPVRFASSEKFTGNILLKKKGFKDESFNLEEYNFEKGNEIFLKSIFSVEEKIVIKDRGTNFGKKRNLTGIITSGILAITTGMLAYNTKEKANDFYNQYLDNRSQDNLDKSNKYDLYSGISLAIMQVSIAGLIYFLFLQ
ncbi:MAG: hypothetical protein NTU73_11105 [Ignavibacteriae bacterium]|nr:hypothetical protein [Ignavibacteriota bacterium]